MSDATIAGLVTLGLAAIAMLQAVFSGIMAYLLARMKQQNDAAAISSAKVAKHAAETAEKVAEVKNDLAEANTVTAQKLDDLATVANNTNDRVTNGTLANLRIHAALARRMANSPGATRDDADVARAADKACSDYVDHQQMINAAKVEIETSRSATGKGPLPDGTR